MTEKKMSEKNQAESLGHGFMRLVPLILFLWLLFFLVNKLDPNFGGDANGSEGAGKGANEWFELLKLGVAVLIAGAAGLAAKLVLSPSGQISTPVASAIDHETYFRGRMARLVVTIGGFSIVVLTLGVVISIAVIASQKDSPIKDNVDTILMGVFGAVLPVLATWVGTVIAFYFTNESYREAARASQEAARPHLTIGAPVRDKMLPYEQMQKFSVADRSKVGDVKLSDYVKLFRGVDSRVLIYEKEARNPIFVLRRKLIPEDWITEAIAAAESGQPGGKTIDEYRKLNKSENGKDSTQFGFVPLNSTVPLARQTMRDAQCRDLFVTQSGQKTEPVLGWLTDDALRE